MRWLLLALLALAACTNEAAPEDASIDEDAGVADLGVAPHPDAAEPQDSGAPQPDAGLPPEDGGELPDGGMSADGGGDIIRPSPGCGMAGMPTGRLLPRDIDVNGTARHYVLNVPDSYDPNTPLALVFGWHGATDNGAGIERIGVAATAGRRAIFVHPDGLPTGQFSSGWVLTETGRDIALFDAIYDEITRSYCVDEARVFSYGFSFGGYMANSVGCYRSNKTRAIAPVAGGLPQPSCGTPIGVWSSHADDDPTVNISEGRGALATWLALNGCDPSSTVPVDPSPCVAYQGCQMGAPVIWCERPSGGHSWPGFASTRVWEFFATF